MIDTRAADTAETTPAFEPGWKPEIGVFILREGEHLRPVQPGVALAGPNGRRAPERKPIVICDPARLTRRRCPRPKPKPRPGELKVGGWTIAAIVIGVAALAAAASCVGSF